MSHENPNHKHEIANFNPNKEKISENAWDKMVTARHHLFKNHPFFGEIAAYLRPQPNDNIETAGITKNGTFFINPVFANKASATDFVFILAHEAMHIVNGTHIRKPAGADFRIWNCAGDIAINYLLVNAGIPLPAETFVKPLYTGFENYFGKTHEEIYEDLMKRVSELEQLLKDKWVDGGCEECEEFFKGMSETDKTLWIQRIAAAANSAREAGKLPGGMEEFLSQLTRPKRNWKRLLRLSVQNCIRKKFTWRRLSKRTMAAGVNTPGRLPEVPGVVVYIDTSGSISDAEMNEALSEMTGILEVTGGKGTLILGDAIVYYCGEVTKKSLTKLPVQRGGTDFNPVFETIEKEKLNPKCFVGFSDLCGPFPEKAPDYKCIWVRPSSYQQGTAPFGKVLDAEFSKSS